MKCGVVMHPTNFTDWDRFHAERWTDPIAPADNEIWDSAIHLVELAEESGFDKMWTTEHRASPYGLIPNPLTFLAFVAGRTKRIGVGTQVIVVPWWQNPLRAAEEIGMLDAFLQGRDLTIGFGRGVAAREYDTMGIDRNESRGRFTEGIRLIKLALSQEHFSFDGEYFQFDGVVVRPRPSRDLTAGLVGAFAGSDSLEACARLGIGMITVAGKPPALIGEDVARFNGIRAEVGLPPMQPIIQIICFCAPTADEALDGQTWFHNFDTEVNWHYRFHEPEVFAGVKGYEQYHERAVENKKHPFERGDELLFAGTPEMIIDRLREVQEKTSAREFVVNFFLAGMPVEVAEKSMKLFAEEVLPVVQEWEAPLHEPAAVTATG